jgi:transposase
MARATQKKDKAKFSNLPVMRSNAAGIDIGATEIFVAVPAGRDPDTDVRSFPTFTQDLYRLAAWLKQCHIDTVAMESTGVYWIPLFQILESEGIEVFLVNAKHVSNVPGRPKTDVKDCQWLQFLHSVGLLNASYRPAQEVCAIRSILRHRQSLVRSSSRHIQRMHKSMDQMNIQLHHVINDITGKSGMAIVDAILDGERNPDVLAKLSNKRIKASKEVIAKSLVGDYCPEHIFTLHQSVEAYRCYLKLIDECDREIQRLLDEFESTATKPFPSDPDFGGPVKKNKAEKKQREDILNYELRRIFGVDLTKIPGLGLDTVLTLLGEVGPNLAKFRSAASFASWLTVCPNNKISGGKVLSAHTQKTSSRAANALRFAAQSLHHNKSALGDFYRRMRAKHGAPKAIIAAAHKLARIIYILVTSKQEYAESHFVATQLRDKRRQEKSLLAKAKALGFELVRTTEAA